MKKKSNLFIMLPILLTGCGYQATHTDPVKKVEYLYEITFESYNWKSAKKSLTRLPEGNLDGFGCSSCRNGNYYGRSFDFTFNNMSEFVVTSTAGKYKNIGIAIANTETTPTMVEEGLSSDQYNVLPFSIVDGINEKGVVCNANVVPVHDLVSAGGSYTTGTNPGKEDYFYQFLCRYILDNAATANEAVELIKNNINVTNTINGHHCDYYTLDNAGYELHYMVADENNTYVIEFINNEIKVIEETVMTNFYISYINNHTPCAAGIERYNTLKEHYNEGTSVEGMAHLMQRVQYSNIVKIENNDLSSNVCWYSDLTTSDFSYEDVKTLFEVYPEETKKLINAGYQLFTSNKRNGESVQITLNIGAEVTMEVKAPWQSTHMSVYDIKNKTLRLVTQEQYERVFNYSL